MVKVLSGTKRKKKSRKRNVFQANRMLEKWLKVLVKENAVFFSLNVNEWRKEKIKLGLNNQRREIFPSFFLCVRCLKR